MPDTQNPAPGTHLPVMERFYTLQGEGAYTGHSAYFIRLGGCDVGCHWCDVKESWDAAMHPHYDVDFLAKEAAAHPGRLCVITGGEPGMHPLGPLTEALKHEGFRIHIETSGAHPLSGALDWVCLSPKKFKAALPEAFERADELKVVVLNKMDLKWAEEQAARVGSHCKLYLQPEWEYRAKVLPFLLPYVMANPKWTLSLQTHKWLDIP